MICGEPQMPAALLIGSKSESFGSNLHTTKTTGPESSLALIHFGTAAEAKSISATASTRST